MPGPAPLAAQKMDKRGELGFRGRTGAPRVKHCMPHGAAESH